MRFSFEKLYLRNEGNYLKGLYRTYSKLAVCCVVVRVINVFGTRDNCFSTLGDVTKNECFLSPYGAEGKTEILSTEISDPDNLILLREF